MRDGSTHILAANLPAFEAVVPEAQQLGVERFAFLGDIVGYRQVACGVVRSAFTRCTVAVAQLLGEAGTVDQAILRDMVDTGLAVADIKTRSCEKTCLRVPIISDKVCDGT